MEGPASPTPPSDFATFGHYRVKQRPDGSLEELGRGAMGVTYRAHDPHLRRDVALKVIAAAYVQDEDARRRFQREASAAAQLSHPNVAGVQHLDEQNGEFFYAMEFVAGRSLLALLRACYELREQREPSLASKRPTKAMKWRLAKTSGKRS